MAPKSGLPPALPASSRYELLVRVASGGMATVYVGRLSGAVGFWRLVAVKRAHPHLLEDAMFTRMLVAEARLASKIHHPNVVSVQDVEELDGELLLVMDYVEGASLAALMSQAGSLQSAMPLPVAVSVVVDACAGLHAAHQLTDEAGTPLGLVHRDVSPHNVLVGTDGIGRIADFGIAKVSSGSGGGTTTGALKGKVAYMAPEYVGTGQADVRSDVFALGIVAWEAIAQRRLFRGQNEVETLRLVLDARAPSLSSIVPNVSRSIDAIIAKALEREPDKRFQTAAELGDALESAARRESMLASASDVGAFVNAMVGTQLETRRNLIREKVQPVSGENAKAGAARAGLGVADGDPFRTLTLPVAAMPEQTERVSAPASAQAQGSLVRVASRPLPDNPDAPSSLPFLESTTTGAAARSVDAARRGGPSRAVRIGVLSFVVAMAGLGAIALFVSRASFMTTRAEAPSALTTASPAPSSSQQGPDPTTTSSPAAESPLSIAPPSPSSSALPASSTAVSAKSRPTEVALPMDSAKATTGAKARPAAPQPPPRGGDKAPPNPYGH